MGDVTIRDLRNHGGDVVDRVQKGERFTVTRSGRPVAHLVPVPREALSAATLIERRRNMPIIDASALRKDVDDAADASL